jgi:hypothetical protein
LTGKEAPSELLVQLRRADADSRCSIGSDSAATPCRIGC